FCTVCSEEVARRWSLRTCRQLREQNWCPCNFRTCKTTALANRGSSPSSAAPGNRDKSIRHQRSRAECRPRLGRPELRHRLHLPRVAAGSKPIIWKGAVAAVLSPNSYGSGSTSKMLNPPRTAVFPSLNGSQEKPIRGSKFLLVGLFAMKPWT